MAEQGRYVAALRFSFLNPLFDPVVRMTTREVTFKRALLDQAGIEPGQRVLDLACGTGTLAILAAERCPGAEIVGLDGDPAILERARAKAREAGAELSFEHGFSTELPFEDSSFDRVLSTLFFHHLTSADKLRTFSEIERVLKPGGELHAADFGKPDGPLTAAAFLPVRVFDGFEQTRANVAGRLPAMLSDAGLEDAREGRRFRTPIGSLALLTARAPAA